MVKHHDQTQLGEERVFSSSSREVRAGTQYENQEVGANAENTEEWLVSLPLRESISHSVVV